MSARGLPQVKAVKEITLVWNFPCLGAPLRLHYSLSYLLSGKLKCWPRSDPGAEPNGEVKKYCNGINSKTFVWCWYCLWSHLVFTKQHQQGQHKLANREERNGKEVFQERLSGVPSNRQVCVSHLLEVPGEHWQVQWPLCGPWSWWPPQVSPLMILLGFEY